jgi:peptidyl-prolyl cis-trans isomerase C
MTATSLTTAPAAINGVPICGADERLTPEVLRQRACSELLRQAACRSGLLGEDDAPGADGILSEAASDAIEALLERELAVEEPSEEVCRRYFDNNPAAYRSGERVQVRHILFAVTPGTDVVALRRQAEATLLEVRCHDDEGGDRFGRAAHDLSNCPSGAEHGALGWLDRSSCVPEFAAEIFGCTEVGVLPRLVNTRFGLHVVEVQARDPGKALSFEAAQGAIASTLRNQRYVTELRRYVASLAAQARIEGVDLDAFGQVLDNG